MNLPVVNPDLSTCCASVDSGSSGGSHVEHVAQLFKALADPVRLRLFADIAAQPDEICVCDIRDVGVSQPTVSHHLKKLREAGLIAAERRGTWVYYRVVPGALEALSTSLDFPKNKGLPKNTVAEVVAS
jgi:ArsR family transcriptional regulator